MKKRLLQVLILVVLLSPISAFAVPQIVTQDGKTYCYDNGVKLKGFQEVEGDTYFFGRANDNPMRTGTLNIDENYYHFNEDGKMHKGLLTENNTTYYFDNNGKRVGGFQKIGNDTYFFGRYNDHPMRTGLLYIDGDYYHFNNDGKMTTGWFEENNKKYYYDENGKRVSSFQTINNNTYFFSRVGSNEMRTGEIIINNNHYLFNEDGTMYTGVLIKDDKEYYYDTNGVRRTGIVTLNNKSYFYNTSGVKSWGFQNYNGNTYFFGRLDDHPMRTGFLKIDDYYYYFKNTGEMVTGFVTTPDGIRRFFGRLNGQMRTGWVSIDGSMYYFDLDNGSMVTGNKTIDGINYNFESNGKLKTGFVTDSNGNRKYYFTNGKFADDWYIIAGQKCFFNSLGVLIGEGVQKIIDVSKYQKTIDWPTVKNSGSVDGAIVRAGFRGYGDSGRLVEDEYFYQNVQGAKSVGLKVGAYFYSQATTEKEAIEEADMTIRMLEAAGGKSVFNMPIAFDTEYTGAWENGRRAGRADYLSVDQRTKVAVAFLERIKSAGYTPMIYASKNFLNENLDMSRLSSYKLWVAQYYHYPTYQGNFNMWQYSSTEYVPGINGDVDVSVLFY